MNLCSKIQEELACCAAQDQEPEGVVASHLGECVRCREVREMLRASAELQTRSANRLPDPELLPALPSRFRKMQQSSVPGAASYRPLFRAGAFLAGVAVFCLVLLSFWWRSSSVPEKFVRLESRVDGVQPAYREPAWQAFRDEANIDNLLSDSARGGVATASYRLRDAHLDRD